MSQFTINLIWDDSVLAQPNVAQIEASLTSAAQAFASNFSNPVTLNLHVGWGEVDGRPMGVKALGESLPNLVFRPYAQVQAALPGLPATNPSGSDAVALTDVQAAAIGLPGPTTLDGYVGFGATTNFVYDQSTYSNYGYYLGAVFDHEVSEVMGRVAELGQDGRQANSVLDFYRYTAPGVHSFSATTPASFSTDNGVTLQKAFNTDPTGDTGDWASGINDPFNAAIASAVWNEASATDLAEMVVLGWKPTGTAWNAAIVNSMTEEWFGQAATDSDIATFDDQAARGYTLYDLRQFLLGYPQGQAYSNAEIKLLYDAYFGRDPGASEIAAWLNAIRAGGYDFTMMRAFLLADPAGQAHTTAEIKLLYDTYFGRDPSASDTAAWQNVIVNGGYDFNGMRAFLLADPAGQAHTTAEIKLLYDTYFGRDPSASDTASWQNVIVNGGYDFNGMRAFLLADPAGQAHTNAEIRLLYDTYFARDPSASDTAAWQNAIVNGGYDFNGMRAFLLGDPAGQAHTNAEITSLYETYFGRDPAASEVAAWQNVIVNGGYDFTEMRAFLLNDPAGVAHTNATITSLYDTYFGRDPQASELAAWQGLIASGYDFNGLRTALLNDPAGQAHTNATVTSLYDTYFGRDPQASEFGAWQGLVAAGYDFYQMRDVLERDPGSNGVVTHLDASGLASLSPPAAVGAIDIANFNSATSQIDLSAALYPGLNPLDAAHAHQIASPYGGTDVLITLDATHSLLIEHVSLASLHAGDFLFA